MLAAAREIAAHKQKRDKWRENLDKVIDAAAAKPMPVRSTAHPTMPVEFDLHNGGARSAPASPRTSLDESTPPKR